MLAAATSASDPPVERLIADFPEEMSHLIIGHIPKEKHAIAALVLKKGNLPYVHRNGPALCWEKESLHIRFNVNSTYLWRILNQSQNLQLCLNSNIFSCSNLPKDPMNLQTSGTY